MARWPYLPKHLIKPKEAKPWKRRYIEDGIHIKIVYQLRKDFDERDLIFFHPANGSKRNKRDAAKLKAMGVKPGVPDLIFYWKARTPHNVYADIMHAGAIEIKAPKGKLTPEQKAWRDNFVANGGKWALCRDYDSVKAMLISWGVKTK